VVEKGKHERARSWVPVFVREMEYEGYYNGSPELTALRWARR
jgi:hypothetical protein